MKFLNHDSSLKLSELLQGDFHMTMSILKTPVSVFFSLLLFFATATFASPIAQSDDSLYCKPIFCELIQEGVIENLDLPPFNDFREYLGNFYDMHGYRLAWFNKKGMPTSQAVQIARLLADARDKALDPEVYGGYIWQAKLAEALAAARNGDEAYRVHLPALDAGLTVSFMRYLSHISSGRIDPVEVGADLNVNEKKFDIALTLFQHINDADINGLVREIEPPYLGYRRLLQGLARYRLLQLDQKLGVPLPQSRTIHPGDTYGALGALEYRLLRYGDLAEKQDASRANIYQGALVTAIKSFQKRHGLNADGIIGKRTFEALNTPPAARVEQLILSIERWRWLPDDAGNRIIAVNLPQFRLFGLEKAGYDHYEQKLSMRVIIGKAYRRHQTPIFTGTLRYVVFNPYWNVPYSILRNELLPKIRKDYSYISKHNYEIVKVFDPSSKPLPVSSETVKGLARGIYHLRQKPGPQNALGPVKFIFPNRHSIYLHGTPATSLFRLEERTFSHGCIRVEKPSQLAAFVLEANGGWDIKRVNQVMESKKWTRVNLKPPMPVYILYSSAFPGEKDELNFFPDVYGYDKRLKHAILALGQSL